jgi:hypothetical protein
VILARSLPSFRLEITERNRAFVVVAVVSFLLAVGMLATAVLKDDQTEVVAASGDSFSTQRVISGKGGYELEAPSSWRVQKRGRATTMSSPADDIFVTVGRAPSGNLAASANKIYESVAANYSKVNFMGATEQRVEGRDAVVFSGKATNARDARLRFVGVAFSDEGRNFSMTAFTRADAEAGRVLPRIERILNTFVAKS